LDDAARGVRVQVEEAFGGKTTGRELPLGVAICPPRKKRILVGGLLGSWR